MKAQKSMGLRDMTEHADKQASYMNDQQQPISESQDVGLQVKDNLRAEYDSWSWYYAEFSALRIEVSRLGVLVRVNSPQSPNMLHAYHSHIYTMLQKIRPLVPNNQWIKIKILWLKVYKEIVDFNARRRVINLKIPLKLILDLDRLQEIALIIAQKKGLGIKVFEETDGQKEIDSAIIG